jgi:hypothetical protein
MPDLTPDPLVLEVWPPEGKSQSTNHDIVEGYLGPGRSEDKFRIYADEHLTRFVEVPRDAIIARRKIDSQHPYRAHSRIWLKAEILDHELDYRFENQDIFDREDFLLTVEGDWGITLPRTLRDAMIRESIEPCATSKTGCSGKSCPPPKFEFAISGDVKASEN